MSYDFGKLTSELRAEYARGRTRSIAFRKKQLRGLYDFLNANQQLIISALSEDLKKPWFETIVVEVEFVMNEIRGILHDLEALLAPEAAGKSIPTLFDKAFVQREPYGLVLIIGAWNYPMQLLLAPLVGAIAAGNVAIVKPSELSPACAKLIGDLLPRYLDNQCYRVVVGDRVISEQLLREDFDYIFFTGSNTIGKIIHQAAARNLTPTTLELGGKSPCYVDDSLKGSALRFTTRRIIWGKMMNAGQTCIAPDYILCHVEALDEFLDHIGAVLKEFFGDNPKETIDFGRIVNRQHYDRLIRLLTTSKGKVVFGGETDEQELYIAPTIIANASPNDDIMKEEIFGPLLPVVVVKSATEAIDFINARPKPLAVYCFANDSQVIDRFLAETTSGAMCANDVVLHCSLDSLPFGGVGPSGMGGYHGKYSIETFSHKKAGKLVGGMIKSSKLIVTGFCLVLIRNFNSSLEWIGSKRYPPYTKNKLSRLLRLIKKRNLPSIPYGETILVAAISFIAGVLCNQYYKYW